MRTSEGQVGSLQVLILAKDTRQCQSIEVPLQPLNLHQRIVDEAAVSRQNLSKIVLKAKNLDLEDSLLWLQQILPGVPKQVDARNEMTLIFENILLKTCLLIKMRRPSMADDQPDGILQVESDNYSTITIMKD